MPHDPLAAVRQGLFGMLRDEGIGLGPQRRRQHAARALTRDLGQRILHGSGLVKRGDRGIVVHGVSLLREVLAGFSTRHDTPPSQAASPIFEHSSAGTEHLASPENREALADLDRQWIDRFHDRNGLK
jgi:hypothetical protein